MGGDATLSGVVSPPFNSEQYRGMPMPISQDIEDAIEGRRDAFLNTLFRLLRQPSISAQGIGVTECAELTRTILEEHGIPGRVMPTAGLPVVYGERHAGEDANTILIYGHYDVQPPEPYEAWISPPFEPTIRDGRIYARGSADNKGQFLAHILAIKVLVDLGRLPRLNIKLLLEGEEESSSPNLPEFVESHRDLLKADLMFAADGPSHLSNRPIVFFGMRGNLKIMFQPTLNITGIAGGYAGKGAKSAIPSRAVAKLETRLVCDMDPDETFSRIERHVRRYAPDVTIRKLAGTRPSKTCLDLPVSRMMVGAIADAYGVEPVIQPVLGGASPNYLFTNVLKMPAIWATYGPPDQNNHSPNENITLGSFFDGIRASALVLQRFAAMPRSDLVRPAGA